VKVTEHVERLLRQGKKPKELVELGFPKRVVTRVHRQLRKEKTAVQTKVPEVAPQTKTQLQTPPESPEEIATIWQKVQSMANDLQRIDSLTQALSEVTVLMVAALEFGIYRHETCPYQKDGFCYRQTWSSQDEIPQGIGEPVLVGDENPEWHVKPSPFYCAMCSAPLEDHIDDLEDKLSGDPLSGAKHQFTCNSCGSKGWIAAKIKCAKCGHETYRGWWPEKE
jgi:ribosomal protein L37E